MKLSVIMVAKNAQETIRDSLESVKWANERIVVDDCSTDRTAAIAQKYNAKVYKHKMITFGRQLKYALDRTKGDWVLWLDADEIVNPALVKEMRAKIKADSVNGYTVYFNEFFLGKSVEPRGRPVQGNIRLVRKAKTKLLTSDIHPRFIVNGVVGKLSSRIIHHSHRTLAQSLAKCNQFSTIEAGQLFAAGGRTSWWKIVLAPVNFFYRNYVTYKYYQSGKYGLVRSLVAGIYYLMKHLKLWEMQEGEKRKRKR